MEYFVSGDAEQHAYICVSVHFAKLTAWCIYAYTDTERVYRFSPTLYTLHTIKTMCVCSYLHIHIHMHIHMHIDIDIRIRIHIHIHVHIHIYIYIYIYLYIYLYLYIYIYM